MKIFAYMTVCLCLPFVLLAEDTETEAAEPSPDKDAEAAEAVTDPGFERFKTILDRMPFGRPPPGFNPDAPGGAANGKHGASEADPEAVAEAEASEVEQQIISSVRVSMLNRTAEGRVFVGFTDSSVQPPKNYLLELGEKREQCEWQVVGADPDNRQVTLSKGGVEATLKVGGGAGSSDDKKAKEGEEGEEKGAARPGLVRGRHPPLPTGPAGEEGGERKLSALDRVRARRQRNLEMQQAERERQRLAVEQERKEREQEAQERKRAAQEREQEAQERKEYIAQLRQISDNLRREREAAAAERQSTEEAPQAGEAPQTGEEPEPVEE